MQAQRSMDALSRMTVLMVEHQRCPYSLNPSLSLTLWSFNGNQMTSSGLSTSGRKYWPPLIAI
jgi:hypothetical protein